MMDEGKFKRLMELIAELLKGKEIPTQEIDSKIIGIFRIILQ